MQSINERTTLKRTTTLLEAEVDGEVMALDVARGQCYGLDIGSHVWRLLENDTTISEICSILTSEYEVDLITCKIDVTNLIVQMNSAGLLTTKDDI